LELKKTVRQIRFAQGGPMMRNNQSCNPFLEAVVKNLCRDAKTLISTVAKSSNNFAVLSTSGYCCSKNYFDKKVTLLLTCWLKFRCCWSIMKRH